MDQFDRAQKLEQIHRDRAINAAKRRPSEQPMFVEGIQVCIDCLDDIDPVRLKHIPDAVRCISCQQDYERRNVQ
ncbi:TraR/DksA family transcriptional regulator [Idiomarina loihiensis]|uniref:TraR/DksA C4-type zinc finger protein n=1 Tax=Idiomarina TaxID=135575 RepID=UPI000D70E81C|nr:MULTISPECIES: TraR/DksA C4-type zinc finger protein [Idiomarina]PWW41609.1 TraR/DksA family transcriptional regulator [Idiomarina loihiensis]TDP50667.1 TraR/DksA family transcriptional regulator [Idiomarina loihiensis]TDS25055.1 TraR/DksA family transcriptional regulator [Idiomarina sp. H2]